ncbi:MAG: trehalose-6-phosphate synthase [Phycisphaeraceae bacterium]|nr:MAG: trehalose-6-phosphate synthase [Phycisphaeraceae bacterium]
MAKRALSKFVVVANRLPVNRKGRGASARWEMSPGGLVSALTPILQARDGAWIGWGGSMGAPQKPFAHEGIQNYPLALSRDAYEKYYEGYSNSTLWPLYHDAVRPPQYQREWWYSYEKINRAFAERTAEVAGKNALVWVQDYHLHLVPGFLRELRPDLRIGFFLHIPFPPQELFAQLPWRTQMITGTLGADVVGFQTRQGAQNFSRLARRLTAWEGTDSLLKNDGRSVKVRDFPISIDVARFRDVAARDSTLNKAEKIRRDLGGRRIILGVDRLDYTKGIDLRLRAFRELLESGRTSIDEAVMVQTAVPSREQVGMYKQIRTTVEQLVGEINGAHARVGRTAVHYLFKNLAIEDLVALYLAADIMLVTPYRDGMNLIAKEYIASKVWNDGVLILSEFTGAANELKQALLINPHDLDGLADAILTALNMPLDERQARMKPMRKHIAANDVYHWADSFIEAMEA